MDVTKYLETPEMSALDWLALEFSFSKLNTFRMCARKARLRYLERAPDSTSYMIFGKAIHGGQEVDNHSKLKGVILPLPEVLDAAVTVLKETEWQGPELDTDLFATEHYQQLEALEEKGIRAQIRPVAKTIEAPFEIALEIAGEKPAVLKGFVDLVNQATAEAAEVIDYKSGSRPVYQGDAERSYQFALYDIGAKVASHRIISFVRGGRQKPTVHITAAVTLTPAKVERLLTFLEDSILAWRDALKSGNWPKCSPTAHYCSQKACAYFDRCYPGTRAEPRLFFGNVKAVGTVEMPAWRTKVEGQARKGGGAGEGPVGAGGVEPVHTDGDADEGGD